MAEVVPGVSKIFVGFRDTKPSIGEIREIFSKHGTITGVKLYSKFCFIEYDSKAAAEGAVAAAENGYLFKDIKLEILNVPKRKHAETVAEIDTKDFISSKTTPLNRTQRRNIAKNRKRRVKKAYEKYCRQRLSQESPENLLPIETVAEANVLIKAAISKSEATASADRDVMTLKQGFLATDVIAKDLCASKTTQLNRTQRHNIAKNRKRRAKKAYEKSFRQRLSPESLECHLPNETVAEAHALMKLSVSKLEESPSASVIKLKKGFLATYVFTKEAAVSFENAQSGKEFQAQAEMLEDVSSSNEAPHLWLEPESLECRLPNETVAEEYALMKAAVSKSEESPSASVIKLKKGFLATYVFTKEAAISFEHAQSGKEYQTQAEMLEDVSSSNETPHLWLEPESLECRLPDETVAEEYALMKAEVSKSEESPSASVIQLKKGFLATYVFTKEAAISFENAQSGKEYQAQAEMLEDVSSSNEASHLWLEPESLECRLPDETVAEAHSLMKLSVSKLKESPSASVIKLKKGFLATYVFTKEAAVSFENAQSGKEYQAQAEMLEDVSSSNEAPHLWLEPESLECRLPDETVAEAHSLMKLSVSKLKESPSASVIKLKRGFLATYVFTKEAAVSFENAQSGKEYQAQAEMLEDVSSSSEVPHLWLEPESLECRLPDETVAQAHSLMKLSVSKSEESQSDCDVKKVRQSVLATDVLTKDLSATTTALLNRAQRRNIAQRNRKRAKKAAYKKAFPISLSSEPLECHLPDETVAQAHSLMKVSVSKSKEARSADFAEKKLRLGVLAREVLAKDMSAIRTTEVETVIENARCDKESLAKKEMLEDVSNRNEAPHLWLDPPQLSRAQRHRRARKNRRQSYIAYQKAVRQSLSPESPECLLWSKPRERYVSLCSELQTCSKDKLASDHARRSSSSALHSHCDQPLDSYGPILAYPDYAPKSLPTAHSHQHSSTTYGWSAEQTYATTYPHADSQNYSSNYAAKWPGTSFCGSHEKTDVQNQESSVESGKISMSRGTTGSLRVVSSMAEYPSQEKSDSGIEDSGVCAVIITEPNLRQYGLKVASKIHSVGLKVEICNLPPGMTLMEAVEDALIRGILFAVVITRRNVEHNSVTLSILHGVAEGALIEHRNLVLDDAVRLIASSYQDYIAANRGNAKSSAIYELTKRKDDVVPNERIQMLTTGLARNQYLTCEELHEIGIYLTKRQEELIKESNDLGSLTSGQRTASKQQVDSVDVKLQKKLEATILEGESPVQQQATSTKPTHPGSYPPSGHYAESGELFI